MQSSSSSLPTKGGLKDGMDYQRSLTKQALKRLASVLKKKTPPSPPQKSGGGSNTSSSHKTSLPADEPEPPGTDNGTPEPTSKGPKKQVSFYGMVQIRSTIGLHEMSPQERSAAWYRKHEYFMIANKCARLVQQLRRGKTIECSRGLGNRIRRDTHRRSAVDIVLDEQDRQAVLGVLDEEYIAFLYHSASSDCLRWSNLVALKDEKEAQIVYREETEMSLSLTGLSSPPTEPKKNICAVTTPPVRRNRNVGSLSVVEFVEEALSASTPCSPSSSPPPPFNGAKAA